MTMTINGSGAITGLSAGGLSDASITQADLALDASSIGVGQTWQIVTGSRLLSTTYTNGTGKPIVVQVGASGTVTSNLSLTIGGVLVGFVATGTDSAVRSMQAIVPPSATYVVTAVGGNATIQNWTELR